MTEGENAPVPAGFSKHRIEALNDGVFAIAMTLLVLGIEVPQRSDLPAVDNLLVTLIPDMVHYVIAFLALAVIWILHHQQFHYIRFIDQTLLWFNIMWLMLVGLMPFSTSLADTYYGIPLAHIPFASNLFLISVILFGQWQYAARKRHLIIPEMTPDMVAMERKRTILILVITFIGSLLAFVSIFEGVVIYLLIPLAFAFFPRICQRRNPGVFQRES